MDVLIAEIANTAGRTIGDPFLLALGGVGALMLASGTAARIAILIEDLPRGTPHTIKED